MAGANTERKGAIYDPAVRPASSSPRGTSSSFRPRVLAMVGLLAALGMAALAVVTLATPASAHAVLLRTQPGPQTTAARSPTTVRLFFSEPVEVTFGAVRVFDVDGHRVDRGPIRREGGNREVVVDTPRLKAGTYTVTWRAVSDDGHPVHGGFAFYAVRPSSISAVSVNGDTGAGRAVGWGFGVDRFLWFAAFLGLVGVVVVRRWVWTPSVREQGLTDTAAADRFRAGATHALTLSWVVLAVATLGAIVFQSAAVSGLAFVEAAKPSVLHELLYTTFGHLWVVQMVVVVVLALPVWALTRQTSTPRPGPSVWLAVMAVALIALAATSALNGHARTLVHAAVGVPSLAVHLLAVGVWVGGLAVLVLVGAPAWLTLGSADRGRLLRALVPRFSRAAVAAVLGIVVTGTVNAYLSLSSASDLWKITYGRVVLAKIVLLMIALLFGARHLLATPKRLAAGTTDGTSFRWTTTVELVVLAATVALAAGLVALVPGRSIALQASGSVAQEHRAGAFTIQLFADPGRAGANDIHVTFVTAQGLAASDIGAISAELISPAGRRRSLAARLLSPGHFVASADLSPGRYTFSVRTGPGLPAAASTFHLTIHAKG